jgi:hypothetical protein
LGGVGRVVVNCDRVVVLVELNVALGRLVCAGDRVVVLVELNVALGRLVCAGGSVDGSSSTTSVTSASLISEPSCASPRSPPARP